MSEEKIWYSPKEVAKVLNEPVRNVYRWIRTGDIPALRIGHKLKIHARWLERIQEQR